MNNYFNNNLVDNPIHTIIIKSPEEQINAEKFLANLKEDYDIWIPYSLYPGEIHICYSKKVISDK